ncbi:hypothetical protein O6H91_01G050200 [Diphasiastrum complanatum]|uniref:Uncharacterized protein n=1 Tax=Diphasiastrum complanatum TaxID=34168 RepID=A0ACC2ER31_DIPCM|nr:hypothetical protein O6H91_01G050200 [Diphasiastrum complanatum]
MDTTKDGSVDFKNRPALKKKTGGWKAAVLVFGTELCERLGAYGIGLNLVTYLINELHISGSTVPNIVTNFLGTSYLCCLIGGFVADAFLGRFLTIAIFSIIQFLGMSVLTISASLPSLRPPECSTVDPGSCRPAKGVELAMLYLALYSMALGTGGIKSCVSAFGADQFDEYDPDEKRHMSYYFNWFFVCITTGALVAVTLLVYVQDNIGRGIGYGLCAGSMLIAISVFVAGIQSYRFKAPAGSPLTPILQVLVAAYYKRKLELPSDPNLLYEEPYGKRTVTGLSTKRLAHTKQFRFLDKAAIVEADDYNESTICPWRLSTVTRVEEVKMLIRVLPIWASTFAFWTSYAQTATFTIEQATTLDRRLGKHFVMPPATAGVFIQASVIITVALYDRVFVPIVRRFTGNIQGITTLQRMGFGLLFSVLAMITAALVERHRIAVVVAHNLLDKPKAIVPMSVFWLLPQYAILGIGEVFAYIGQLEFFYKESPDGMRSIGTGLSLSTVSLGYFLSSFLVTTVDNVTKTKSQPGWLSNNLNRSKLYNFYWLLVVVSTLNWIIYLTFAHWYRYKAARSNSEVEAYQLANIETL